MPTFRAPTPRRRVVEAESGYRVTDSEFWTTDPVLAAAVAKELDRVDPVSRPPTAEDITDRTQAIRDEMRLMIRQGEVGQLGMRRFHDLVAEHLRLSTALLGAALGQTGDIR